MDSKWQMQALYNWFYATVWGAELRNSSDDAIQDMLQFVSTRADKDLLHALVDKEYESYLDSVKPDWRGDAVIPTADTMHAWIDGDVDQLGQYAERACRHMERYPIIADSTGFHKLEFLPGDGLYGERTGRAMLNAIIDYQKDRTAMRLENLRREPDLEYEHLIITAIGAVAKRVAAGEPVIDRIPQEA